MKLGKKGKFFALAGMILLLVVTGYLNVYVNNKSNQTIQTSTITVSNFFETYRSDRTKMREQTVMYLDSVINSELSSAETIAQAQESKMEIVNSIETELKLESVIKALGFEDVVVSSSNENYNIILKSTTLNDEEVAKVLEVVTQQTGTEASNVIIIPVEWLKSICQFIMAIGISIVLGVQAIDNTFVIVGIAFLIIMFVSLIYMKRRVGLKPEQYSKKDIEVLNPKDWLSYWWI